MRKYKQNHNFIGIYGAFLLSTTFVTYGYAQTPSIISSNHPKVPAHQDMHNGGTVSASAIRPARKPNANAASGKEGDSVQASGAELLGVVGHHLSHATASIITQTALARNVAGANPLQTLGQLPGVMFAGGDGQGLDIWTSQLYVRGFQSNQIGATLDGMPLGEQTFYNYNGLGITQAISPENIRTVSISQGAGAEDVAATSSLGGAISYASRDPAKKKGAEVSQTFGSYNMFRTFVRLDSGEIGPAKTRFYVSYARNDTNKWTGVGPQFQQVINAKLYQPIGESSHISAFFDYSDVDQMTYMPKSLEILNTVGQRPDYYYGTPNGYRDAYMAAEGNYMRGENRSNDPKDVSYYDGVNEVRDYMGGINYDFLLTNRLRLTGSIYGHRESFYTTWANPYTQDMVPAPNGAALSEDVTHTGIQRFGGTTNLAYNIAHHDINVGFWYENNHFNTEGNEYSEPVLGTGSPLNSWGPWNNPYATLYAQIFNTNTFVAHVSDTYSPVHGLKIHYGFRSLLNTTRVGALANYPDYTGASAIAGGDSLTTAKAFLPHINIDWNFRKHHELYFDFAENVRAFPVSTYGAAASPLVNSQQAYEEKGRNVQPETAWAYSIGYRYTSRYLTGSISAYRVDFHNRLQALSYNVTPTQFLSSVQNVGSVNMNGVDAALTFIPVHGLNIYNSISYNHATYAKNITSDGITYYSHGRQVVGYPSLMYKASASYSFHNAEVFINTSYIGRRNLSYGYTAQDPATSVPSYWLTNLGASYDFGRIGIMKNFRINFNVYNLTNVRYIGAMGVENFPLAGDQDTLQMGAPRMFYGGLRAQF
ncbi:TonB-dependent receptor [Novacetimonas hansenii]|uniref:TonB-dependent receptor n=1 Tax=Novacetimonas hansenii TaxID=436 RepID=UPI0009D75B30|nr:TonB-dependent receptor [Novacetimonas hansenii]PYD71077.1 TonB-dependent receptor [Novacetimonas hansenii]